MKVLRAIVFTVALVLLGAGYAASQFAYFQGAFASYAAEVDCPAVRGVSLLLLLCCIVFPFLRTANGVTEP